MRLDLRKLKRSGKDKTDFYFEYQPETNLSESIPDSKILFPIKVSGSVTLTGDHSAYVEGEVVFTIGGACTRCLEQASATYTADFAESVSDDADEVYPLVNDTVDLTKIVDDVILMNVPVTFLCSDDCKGICVGCGVNLNNGECKCKK